MQATGDIDVEASSLRPSKGKNLKKTPLLPVVPSRASLADGSDYEASLACSFRTES